MLPLSSPLSHRPTATSPPQSRILYCLRQTGQIASFFLLLGYKIPVLVSLTCGAPHSRYQRSPSVKNYGEAKEQIDKGNSVGSVPAWFLGATLYALNTSICEIGEQGRNMTDDQNSIDGADVTEANA